MNLLKAKRNFRCTDCNYCREAVCPSTDECIGCSACFIACPYNAVDMVKRQATAGIKININGKEAWVPKKITVKKALELHGCKFSRYPGEGIFAPCEVGGCWACTVKINGKDVRSCITPVQEGMVIYTSATIYIPKRLICGFAPHAAGGVGTPLSLKGLKEFVELVCFTCGCNFRCPQCQNWSVAYRGKQIRGVAENKTPDETASMMTLLRRKYNLNRLTISGGESTLNRLWLVSCISKLKKLNTDSKLKIHIDTNGSVLTYDYIDELVEAGMTDIGIDLKGLRLNTFMKITGLEDKDLSKKYLDTAWNAVKYINRKYKETIFLGLGIPYNKAFISLDEIRQIGEEICKIDPKIQVCLIDYRGEFRSKFSQPEPEEMKSVLKILKTNGLKTACCQTKDGYFV